MAYFTYETKRIFYRITGSGKPLALLHGNTASSKMFEMLLPLYTPQWPPTPNAPRRSSQTF